MPLFYHKYKKHEYELGIWKITEGLDYFKSRILLYEKEKEEISSLSDRKKLEWFASRYLLHMLSGREERGPCLKDEYGKPYLLGSTHYISMSHSRDKVAVIASAQSIGVDIQVIVEKITRIAKKFCNEDELSFIDDKSQVEFLHFIWGIKECIYKAYGRKELNFSSDIYVHPFKIIQDRILTHATLSTKSQEFRYFVYGEKLKDFILTYVVEDHL